LRLGGRLWLRLSLRRRGYGHCRLAWGCLHGRDRLCVATCERSGATADYPDDNRADACANKKVAPSRQWTDVLAAT
jgi:hypothetical protein